MSGYNTNGSWARSTSLEANQGSAHGSSRHDPPVEQPQGGQEAQPGEKKKKKKRNRRRQPRATISYAAPSPHTAIGTHGLVGTNASGGAAAASQPQTFLSEGSESTRATPGYYTQDAAESRALHRARAALVLEAVSSAFEGMPPRAQ